jgi:hypothetical protein
MISRAFELLLGGAHRFLDDSNIVFERYSETMFTTESPVSSMLLNESLSESPSGRGPTLMQSIGCWRSVRNDENHTRIEFRALLTKDDA